MDFLAKVAIVSAAMVLSACKTPEVNCTVKIPPQSLDVSAMTTAVTISGSMAAIDSTLTLDAASMTIDVSDSTVAFPPTGSATLRIVNKSNGATLRSSSFGWYLSGAELRFTSPSAVNSWLQSSGANVRGFRVDYSLDNITVTNAPDVSYIAATVEMYQQPIASGSATYNSGGGRICEATCHVE